MSWIVACIGFISLLHHYSTPYLSRQLFNIFTASAFRNINTKRSACKVYSAARRSFMSAFQLPMFTRQYETIGKLRLTAPQAFLLSFPFCHSISSAVSPQIFDMAFLFFVCVFGMSNFVSLFDAVLAKIGFNGSYALPIPMDNFGYLVLNLILLAVLPAICEELVFRGIIFNGLKQYGNMKAVFLSATLFMLVHSSVEQTVYPFFVGIVLALLMLRTNNIIYPILLHFLNNAIVVVINYISVQSGAVSEFTLSTFNILFAIALAILAVLCIVIVFKIILKNKNKSNSISQENLNQNESSPNTFLYVGIIGAIIIWIFDLISGFVA